MKKLIALLFISFLIVSCGNKSKKNETESATSTTEAPMPEATTNQVAIGDIVPNDLVCMVNNDYMGQEQLEVEVDGKTYYGCCEMCQERLPNDKSARTATDPISNEDVDKADAVIAVTGNRGEVTYFENEENYNKYVETVLN